MTNRPSVIAILVGAFAATAGCGSEAAPPPSGVQRTGCAAAPTAPVAPGGYYVNGNTVCTSDGRPHLFHGVARPSLEWSSGGEGLSAADFRRMASWKANVVRVALNQDFWLAASPLHDANYPGMVDAVVTWAEAAGMDVILDLHWSDRGVLGSCPRTSHCQQRMADANSVTFWSEIARHFAGDGRVMFELYNEPHDVSWDVWLNGGDTGEGWQAVGMQQLYDTVRAAGADNLVIAGGLDWGYDLSGVPSHRVAGYNVAYATHPYNSGNQRRSRFWDVYWGALTATDPVVVTEFGDTAGCSDDYVREVVDYADSHAAGWIAWAWVPRGCGFPSLLDDWTGTPSALGGIIKAALTRYDDPAAAARPDAGMPTIDDDGVGYQFDRSSEGWWLDDFADPLLANLAAPAPGAGTKPSLAFAKLDGDPTQGGLRLTATFTGLDQYAQAVVAYGEPGINRGGKTLRARVRRVSGPLFGGGVQLAALSGATYLEASGPLLDVAALPDGVWVPLSMALDDTGVVGFDSSRLYGIAVRLRSGTAAAGGAFQPDGGETIVEIDSVAD